MAVVHGQMRVQFAQIKELINAAKQMVGGNVIVKVEGVGQGCLCSLLTPHHRENPGRSMGDQSITFITPRQERFSTLSAKYGRSARQVFRAQLLKHVAWPASRSS